MMNRLLAVTALTLSLGTVAWAQTESTSGTTSTTATGIPSTWEEPVRDAFFSDPAAGTLRSDDEIRSRWSSLSSEQQSKVKSDCQTIMASSGTGTDTTTTTGSTGTTGTTGSDTTASTSSATGTTGTAGSDATHMASMKQLCTMVQGM